MSRDFEQRLREALHSTAAQVETSPETWERVGAGIRRRRLGQLLSVGLASVAAVVVAVAVLPGLVAGDRIGLDPGPAAPAAAPAAAPTGPAAVAPPAGVVTTDGTGIVVQLGTQGTDEVEVPGAELSSLAVWPRSTARAFQVVAVDEAACRLHLYASGLEAVRPVEAGARFCSPVAFSPDGRHLAWIETGQDRPVLRTIGWDAEGPRVQDNADFGLDTDLADLRLQDWVWSSVDGEDATGHLVVAGTGDSRQAHRLTIERQGDGALALPSGAELDPISAGAAAGGVVVAEADGGGVTYQLRADGGAGVPELVRIIGGEEVVAPVHSELPRWSSGSSAAPWLTAAGDHVLYGDGEQAFSGRFAGGQWSVGALPGVRAADFLPRLAPRPSG